MSTPTIRELLGWFTPEFLRHQDPRSVVEAGAQLAERVEAVLKLHRERAGRCAHCDSGSEHIISWPCATVRALEGKP